MKSGAKVILLSHLGRPAEKVDEKLRLTPLVPVLKKLLKKSVVKLDECVGAKVENAVSKMKNGDVILLENTRFHPEEKKNDPSFVKKFVAFGDMFVNDAFATVHRDHASISGIAKALPSYAGFLLEREIRILGDLLEKPERPFVIVFGGAKITTKIGLIRNILPKADGFLIGGALANTFLFAEGFEVGQSLVEKDKRDVAQDVLLQADALHKTVSLPIDVVTADKPGDAVTAMDIPIHDMDFNMKIFDIGKQTQQKFISMLHAAKTILWNGPLGLTEYKPFQGGTKAIAEAIAERTKKGAVTIVGGGDTVSTLKHIGLRENQFTHVSTGGGAMLEFLAGDPLPGLLPLLSP